jgi:acyl-homoserine-lactone acylase
MASKLNRRNRCSVLLRAGILFLALLLAPSSCKGPGGEPRPGPEPSGSLQREVEIRRTLFGVPHILGENLGAAAFGLAWVMMEDYRQRVPELILRSNGRWGLAMGQEAAQGDFAGRMAHDLAIETHDLLPPDVQEVLAGFAAGVNHYIEMHGDQLPDWAEPEFSAQDIAARDLAVWSESGARQVRARSERIESTEAGQPVPEVDPDVGSNAWAFAPERTRSGHAVLIRNPHLSFTSGYYEAHITVPGVINFYGDFRLGGPFTIIGGFSERLGWSTTNNAPDLEEIYALLKDPDRPDHFLFDGVSVPLEIREVTVEFTEEDGSTGTETREFRFSPLGPVLHETEDTVFVVKTTSLGQYRLGEQWLRMMQARDLEEWREAMRIQSKVNSNFTYADADGNIFYVWNAATPLLPHPPSADSVLFAAGMEDIWTDLYPWDDLPQLLNPQGGYLQNSNDPFHFTNLNEPFDQRDYPANFPEARVRLRTQNSLGLVHNDRVLSLEEIVELKNSMGMLLADRVKDDLVAAVRQSDPSPDVLAAAELLDEWDNTVSRDSRGSVLFKIWANRYQRTVDGERQYTEPWTASDPAGTPRGLGDPEVGVAAFLWAVEETRNRFGSWAVPWGEVHRVRAGDLDLPVGGCTGGLGCFRVLGYAEDEDGKYRARTGDAWVLAVEFGEVPRAYSVLLYGNSNQEDSPYFYNQAEMFADRRMKVVAFTEEEIERDLVERYRPGTRSGGPLR